MNRAVHILGGGLSGLAASTILAGAGREVHVHELRSDSGARFDGDFQGFENWTSDCDFFDQMTEWGLDSSAFKSTAFREMDVAGPDHEISKITMPEVGFRIVERGTAAHSVDQGFKRMALDAGANIHYGVRRNREDCNIIACGPTETSAFALGELFETSHPNHVTFHLNDKLAPGAYSYMLIVDGVGLICTCLWRKQRKVARFLDETIAWYQRHYPQVDRKPIKRVAGKGGFALFQNYAQGDQLLTGEAAGLQDFLWGFGMRFAVHSGVLAAKHCLGELDYNEEIKRQLLPGIQASVVNRFLFNRIGDRGYRWVIKRWLARQRRTGDGLTFVRELYRTSFFRQALLLPVTLMMLEPYKSSEGFRGRRLAYRAALRRDGWD
jgi:flavin-dependent dehydrogenase